MALTLLLPQAADVLYIISFPLPAPCNINFRSVFDFNVHNQSPSRPPPTFKVHDLIPHAHYPNPPLIAPLNFPLALPKADVFEACVILLCFLTKTWQSEYILFFSFFPTLHSLTLAGFTRIKGWGV